MKSILITALIFAVSFILLRSGLFDVVSFKSFKIFSYILLAVVVGSAVLIVGKPHNQTPTANENIQEGEKNDDKAQ